MEKNVVELDSEEGCQLWTPFLLYHICPHCDLHVYPKVVPIP